MYEISLFYILHTHISRFDDYWEIKKMFYLIWINIGSTLVYYISQYKITAQDKHQEFLQQNVSGCEYQFFNSVKVNFPIQSQRLSEH